jgi:hypothetical protein
MREIRPSCEHCNKKLPPDSLEATICSFECTFCTGCAENLFGNTCPNCGGGFSRRSICPARNWKGDNFPGQYPASAPVKHRPASLGTHRERATKIGSLPPEQR